MAHNNSYRQIVATNYSEIAIHPEQFGSKSSRLAELALQSFPVPNFVCMGTELVAQLQGASAAVQHELLRQISDDTRERCTTTLVAVRSSAPVEDGSTHAHAGEFLTKLAVSYGEIPDTIREIIADAEAKGYATIDRPFALFIQEYIAPDTAGVLFTRNPLGGRELVIEWKHGVGDVVVGGGDVQRTLVLPEQTLGVQEFSGQHTLVVLAQRIARHYGSPQDIEWAVVEGVVSILQARPLTTLSADALHTLDVVDEAVAGRTEYYYDRSAFIETFGHPTPLAVELVRLLYEKGGAVECAYTALGVVFDYRETLHLIAGALYVDREAELQQFFPAYSYFGEATLRPHRVRWSGIVRTFANTLRLQTLPLGGVIARQAHLATLMTRIEALFQQGDASWKEWEALFTEAYKEIFTINIFAGRAQQLLAGKILAQKKNILDVLSAKLSGVPEPETREILLQNLLSFISGNSLNIADTDPFCAKRTVLVENEELTTWWERQPVQQRTRLTQLIGDARTYIALREEGRWVSVAILSGMRRELKKYGDAQGVTDPSLLFFASLDTVRQESIGVDGLDRVRATYRDTHPEFAPLVVSHVVNTLPQTGYGVSPGIATGMVVRPGGEVKQGNILLVGALEPSLPKYFGTISGIIAETGGVLSHMAIVAREYGIPVVIENTALTRIVEGSMVTIDGSKGTIVDLTEG